MIESAEALYHHAVFGVQLPANCGKAFGLDGAIYSFAARAKRKITIAYLVKYRSTQIPVLPVVCRCF
jgi:hypothetical protein